MSIWFPSTKSQNFPWIMCVQVVYHISLESSWWGLQICLNLTSIRDLHNELRAFKAMKVPILGISRLSTWKSQEKWHLGVTLVVNRREYYKGEGGDLPQVWTMMSLVNLCMSLVRLCTKNALTMH
jgi:hypothetical protein